MDSLCSQLKISLWHKLLIFCHQSKISLLIPFESDLESEIWFYYIQEKSVFPIEEIPLVSLPFTSPIAPIASEAIPIPLDTALFR